DPHIELLERRSHDPLLDGGVYRSAEAPTQHLQRHQARALPESFLDALPVSFLTALPVSFLTALLNKLLSGCHDGFLGFGSDLAFKKCFQRMSFAIESSQAKGNIP